MGRKRKLLLNLKRKVKKNRMNKNHLYLISQVFWMRKTGMDLHKLSRLFLRNNLRSCLLVLLMDQEVEDFWANIQFCFYLSISRLLNQPYNSFLMKDYLLFLKEFKTKLLEKEALYFYKILIFCHSKQLKRRWLLSLHRAWLLFLEESFCILR